MSGSSFGKLFRATTWGESHGPSLGVVVDGCPAGLPLCEEDIQQFLNRRKPGQNHYTTRRSEPDQAEILSGLFQGKTTGAPISLLIRNLDQRSQDYGELAQTYRPGHADFPFQKKYGFRDYRGGGRSSGRETVGRVAAGAIASLFLEEMGIRLLAYTKSVGPVSVSSEDCHVSEIPENSLYMPSNEAAAKAASYLDALIKTQDSCGGSIECIATGLPVGLGEPVFDKLDAALAKAVMSVGAVKAVEIGDGADAAISVGSKNNDPFYRVGKKTVKKTNHSGGTLGGMSDGDALLLRAFIKPTPSIARIQDTVTESGKEVKLSVKGRHDPIIVPRAVVVVESMAALTLADLLLENMTSRLDKVKNFYLKEL